MKLIEPQRFGANTRAWLSSCSLDLIALKKSIAVRNATCVKVPNREPLQANELMRTSGKADVRLAGRKMSTSRLFPTLIK